jgi:hypothetical protein
VHKYASVLSAYGLSGAELVEESQAPAAAILVKGGAEEVEQDSAKRVGEVLKEIASAAGESLLSCALFILIKSNIFFVQPQGCQSARGWVSMNWWSLRI